MLRCVLYNLSGKPEEKRPLGRPRRRWEDNIKIDLREVGGGCGDWMELAQDGDRWQALVSTVRNLWVPKMRGISWLASEPVSFSRRTLLHGVSKHYIWSRMILKLDNVYALKKLLRIKFQAQRPPYFEKSEINLNNSQKLRT